MAHKLTFECWHPDKPEPTIRWTAIRKKGEIFFADYCPVCDKVRRNIGCEEIPDPKTPEELRQEALVAGALF